MKQTLWLILAAASTLALTSCGANSVRGASADGAPVGYSIRTLDDPFQSLEAKSVEVEAKAAGLDILPVVNANGDPAKQNQDVNALLTKGIKGLIINPIDADAIVPAIEKANARDVPVVTVDSNANGGEIAIEVTADNYQVGEQACEAMGKALGGKGTVLNLQGTLDSRVGVERSQGFTDCIAEDYPGIKVVSKPMDWSAQRCASAAQTVLSTSDVDGIYTAASIICTAPVTDVLKKLDKFAPAGEPGHVVHVSMDGAPNGLQAVRDGELDAIVSQPLDQFAKYAVYWLQRAMDGDSIETGGTDHNSEVVEVDGKLIDQLPVTTVTKTNVDDEGLWGNQ